MSSSEGLLRLKNWQKAEKALVTPSFSWKGAIRVSEARVKVAFVDESSLVLVNLDRPRQTETVLLRDAGFACTDESGVDLEVTLVDGKKLYLREEE
jgi:hypothetical protein